MLLELTLIGNLGRNAEVRYLSNNEPVISFSVACNKVWKNQQGERQEKTTWVNCSWFTDKTNIVQYLLAGTQVHISGEPRVTTFTNKQDQTIASLEMVVNKLVLLSGSKIVSLANLSAEEREAIEREVYEKLMAEINAAENHSAEINAAENPNPPTATTKKATAANKKKPAAESIAIDDDDLPF